MLDGEDKLSYRLRQSITSKVPMAIVIGDKEIEEGAVNVRRLGEEKGKSLKKDDFVSALLKEIETRKEAF